MVTAAAPPTHRLRGVACAPRTQILVSNVCTHRFTLGVKNLGTVIAQTGRLARIDGYADGSGP
ncbi:MAG TPA: hypothetical protein VG365_07425, partial [Solirubrobacteraceae bacterium]|nr:hypothetical protein [Solirubrobacteraceae bacterium]